MPPLKRRRQPLVSVDALASYSYLSVSGQGEMDANATIQDMVELFP